jgi:hypothetical protein
VRVERLDDHLLPHLERCDFLHFDAEGFEPHILMGAQATIARFKPTMLIEIGDVHLKRWELTPQDVMGILHGLGYEVQRMNTVSVGIPDVDVFNVLCRPRTS